MQLWAKKQNGLAYSAKLNEYHAVCKQIRIGSSSFVTPSHAWISDLHENISHPTCDHTIFQLHQLLVNVFCLWKLPHMQIQSCLGHIGSVYSKSTFLRSKSILYISESYHKLSLSGSCCLVRRPGTSAAERLQILWHQLLPSFETSDLCAMLLSLITLQWSSHTGITYHNISDRGMECNIFATILLPCNWKANDKIWKQIKTWCSMRSKSCLNWQTGLPADVIQDCQLMPNPRAVSTWRRWIWDRHAAHQNKISAELTSCIPVSNSHLFPALPALAFWGVYHRQQTISELRSSILGFQDRKVQPRRSCLQALPVVWKCTSVCFGMSRVSSSLWLLSLEL